MQISNAPTPWSGLSQFHAKNLKFRLYFSTKYINCVPSETPAPYMQGSSRNFIHTQNRRLVADTESLSRQPDSKDYK